MAELFCDTHYRCALQRGQLVECADCGARIDCLIKPRLTTELIAREQTFAVWCCSHYDCSELARIWLYPHEVRQYLEGIRIFAVCPEVDEDGLPYARSRVK